MKKNRLIKIFLIILALVIIIIICLIVYNETKTRKSQLNTETNKQKLSNNKSFSQEENEKISTVNVDLIDVGERINFPTISNDSLYYMGKDGILKKYSLNNQNITELSKKNIILPNNILWSGNFKYAIFTKGNEETQKSKLYLLSIADEKVVSLKGELATWIDDNWFLTVDSDSFTSTFQIYSYNKSLIPEKIITSEGQINSIIRSNDQQKIFLLVNKDQNTEINPSQLISCDLKDKQCQEIDNNVVKLIGLSNSNFLAYIKLKNDNFVISIYQNSILETDFAPDGPAIWVGNQLFLAKHAKNREENDIFFVITTHGNYHQLNLLNSWGPIRFGELLVATDNTIIGINDGLPYLFTLN